MPTRTTRIFSLQNILREHTLAIALPTQTMRHSWAIDKSTQHELLFTYKTYRLLKLHGQDYVREAPPAGPRLHKLEPGLGHPMHLPCPLPPTHTARPPITILFLHSAFLIHPLHRQTAVRASAYAWFYLLHKTWKVAELVVCFKQLLGPGSRVALRRLGKLRCSPVRHHAPPYQQRRAPRGLDLNNTSAWFNAFSVSKSGYTGITPMVG